jgi:3-hydroxymyristoyl/3-hydroxydecanoyl-(acyl carrier protein) dehydratase
MALITRICISPDHPSLPGHFPGRPLIPGVVILDVLCAAIQEELGAGANLTGLPNLKFQHPVLPGQGVDIHVEFATSAAGSVRARFRGTCEQVLAFEGSMTFAITATHAD